MSTKSKADRIGQAKIEDRHSTLVCIGNGTVIPWLTKSIFTKKECAWTMGLYIGAKFLPKPKRHMLESVNTKGINADVKPLADGRFYVFSVLRIILIKSRKS